MIYREAGEYDDRNKMDIQQFVQQALKVRPVGVIYVVNLKNIPFLRAQIGYNKTRCEDVPFCMFYNINISDGI